MYTYFLSIFNHKKLPWEQIILSNINFLVKKGIERNKQHIFTQIDLEQNFSQT